MKKVILLILVSPLFWKCTANKTEKKIAEWSYIEVDSTREKWGDHAEPEWLRYFGLDMGDVNGDQYADIVAGKYIYINPKGDLSRPWQRIAIDQNVDGIFIMDVDGDEFPDVIAQSLPEVFWLEATDASLENWTKKEIGKIPATSHVNSQGFEKVQMISGGKEEFLIAGDGDIYLFEIPENPSETPWKITMVAENTSDEGIGCGDIDGDGDLDIAAGRRPEGEGEPLILVWYQNPGDGSLKWPSTVVGHSNHPIDRVEIADFNGDKKADIIMTEERYPGLEPDGNLFWFSQPSDNKKEWKKNRIVTQHSMNNLDIGDIDDDGDVDLVTGEHKGKALETQLWINNGMGQFEKIVIGTGKESHLGTQFYDMDNDGDLDVVSAAWDNYKYLHLWMNPEK